MMLQEDHPRGCGEHCRWSLSWLSVWGSSPRMRGAPGSRPRGTSLPGIIPADAGSTVTTHHRIPGGRGIIPADAGSTGLSPRMAYRGWDHPRGCGEHRPQRHRARQDTGSSPRMRGARDPKAGCQRPGRIIPADAGSTRSSCSATGPVPDHPPGCGEHQMINVVAFLKQGSSPRMRGAPDRPEQVPYQDRIIPADAGSTRSSVPGSHGRKDHPRGCGEHAWMTR